jgi:hypothetical protein
MHRTLPPVYALHRSDDGHWSVLAPEADPFEPSVRIVAVLPEPRLNAQLDVPARLAIIARTAADAVRSTKVRGRAGGASGAWSR